MATHSSILARRIPWTEEPFGLQYMGSQRVGHNWNDWARTSLSGSPCGSVVKIPPASAGDVGLIPGLGRSPGEGSGNPLQYSCLRNPMDRGAWQAIDHGLAKSQMWLSMYILLYWAWKGDCLYSQEFISRFHMFLMGIFQGQSLVVSTTTPSMDCSLSLYF